MDLRTTIKIEPSSKKITYNDPVMFIGSCFSSSIGSKLELGHMPVMINPAGTVFNPISVFNTINTIIEEKESVQDDLYCHDGNFLSFYHYTDFSSEDPKKVLEAINEKSRKGMEFLRDSQFLFITLGTARVYRWKKTGMIVSNCHKIPNDQFTSELLSVSEIVTVWKKLLNILQTFFPQLKVVFTISPVRHWKDGAHGNQISKSVLLLAVEELLLHSSAPQYFPAYELFMDDLRDYRFYDDDMLHPSKTAINYIWDAFSGCYMENKTIDLYREVVKIVKARNHRLSTNTGVQIKSFAERMLTHISDIESKVPAIDFSSEYNYFRNLLK
jgi:GSCFA family protein